MPQHPTAAAVWFLLFLIYSTIGWCGEMVYCSIGRGKLCEKRGFLNGFLCPIYGFGSLLVLTALDGGCENPLLTFAGGFVLTSAVEYFTSWLMEKLFHMRWWDYSHHRCNINGRVCLLNSTLFGLACVFLCHVAHPEVMRAVHRLIARGVAVPLAAVLLVVFAADVVLSIRSAIQIGNRLQKLQALQDQLQAKFEELKLEQHQTVEDYRERVASSVEATKQAIEEKRVQAERLLQDRWASIADFGEEQRQRWEQFQAETQRHMKSLFEGQDFFERRLLRSYPSLRSHRHGEALEKLRQHLSGRKKT